jgi:hypothetical protein
MPLTLLLGAGLLYFPELHYGRFFADNRIDGHNGIRIDSGHRRQIATAEPKRAPALSCPSRKLAVHEDPELADGAARSVLPDIDHVNVDNVVVDHVSAW